MKGIFIILLNFKFLNAQFTMALKYTKTKKQFNIILFTYIYIYIYMFTYITFETQYLYRTAQ